MGDHVYDPTFTDRVIDAMGPKTNPRLRQLMAGFIRHMHDFARENELTVDEWMSAVQMINWAGKISDGKRNEGQLLCDLIGLESLVDEITYKVATESDAPTPTAILGPFFREDAAVRQNGDSIVTGVDDGERVFMHGQVLDYKTKKPLPGAVVNVWQASTNGLYEQQDPNQVEHNLRGKFTTDENGRYWFYCVKPTPYPVPGDGPGAKVLELLDRHLYRPAHIHIYVTHDGYKSLVTQIFDRKDPYLTNDCVFAVKDSLVVDFVPREGDPKASLELNYDVKLAADEPAVS